VERITLKAVSDTPSINNSNKVRGKQVWLLKAGNSLNALHAKGGIIMMGTTPTDESSLKHNKRVLRPSAGPNTITHNALRVLDVVTYALNKPGTFSINKGNVFIQMRKNGLIIKPINIEGVKPTMVRVRAFKIFNITQHIIKVNEHVGSFSRQSPLRCPPFAREGAKTGREVEDIFQPTEHSRRGSITWHASQFVMGFTLKNNSFIRRTVKLHNVRKTRVTMDVVLPDGTPKPKLKITDHRDAPGNLVHGFVPSHPLRTRANPNS